MTNSAQHPRHSIGYETRRSGKEPALWKARFAVVLIGIALPYLARLPGTLSAGPGWLIAYLTPGFGAFSLLTALNAVTWGAILIGTVALRSVPAVSVAAVVGFALPACCHARLDLASSDSAVVGWFLIPVYSLPLVGLGGLLGLLVDGVSRRMSGRER